MHNLKAHAAELGLQLRGVLPIKPLPIETRQRLDAWFAEGRAGEMEYLERGRPVMDDLRAWKPWAKSVALFAFPYHRPAGGFRGGGQVARYALGRDYHNVIGRKLEKLGKRLRAGNEVQRFRAVTDAAPVLEREWAIRGQIGWRGKNTLLLDPDHGPWVLLGELLVDKEFAEWSAPLSRTATCGSCTACLDACPTDAFTAPFELDPRKCISYLTIETQGPIPEELRPGMGDHVFGCDVCLEVCPFGHESPDHADDWGEIAALEEFELTAFLEMDEVTFNQTFTASPIRRAGWEGFLRNVCVVLGNLGKGREALKKAADHHPSTLVREHAAWALPRMNG